MPRDISSSSSEDEAEAPTKQKETGKKCTRYQCPADFVSFCHQPCSSTLTKSLKNKQNELWLIKAPASFNPECVSGIKVPLSGLQTVKISTPVDGAKSGSSQQIYSILASTQGTSDLRLLTSDKQSSGGVVFGPAFSGLLNICETYGDSSTNQAPQVIPASPAPSIPPGLKQRFHPFGSKTPTLTCEADGAALGSSSTTLSSPAVKRLIEEEEEEDEERKKKKKKKKEKRIKTEREEDVVRVKEEPGAEIQEEVTMELPVQEGDVSEKRKKKKKKKDREQEEGEQGLEPRVDVKQEDVTVKCEPIDSSYSDVVDGSGGKKKKKKKSKTDDD
ncbi:hypothetical protein PAMA_020147 [Pampus argenteus]